MIILGLTGSIGAGKSFAAQCFKELDVPVFDADATVHHLLGCGGAAVQPVAHAFPDAVENGSINRQKLGAMVFFVPDALKKLEAILHPLVKQAGAAFLDDAMKAGKSLIVQDIPLLYETGADKDCHAVIVVSVPEAIQAARVLEREGMNEQKLDAIRSLQLPDAEKCARADFVIDGTADKGDIRRQIIEFLATLAKKE